MKKAKSYILVATAVACAVIFVFLTVLFPKIERHTWILSYAQQAEAPYFVVAHNEDYDFSDNESGLFDFSKEVELTLEAKNGELLIVDKTNGKSYEGTYTGVGRFNILNGKYYTVVIDGLHGTANFSTYRNLFVSIDGYCLCFDIQ